MASKHKAVICYHESRRVFWLRHYLNRLVPKLKRSGVIPVWPRLCAFPNDLIGREMSVAGLYEMAGIRAVENLCARGAIKSPASSIFIDVGANVGVYTTALARHFDTVLAFEPHPVISRILELNIEINHILNAKVFRSALSNRDGKAELTDAGVDNVGASTLEAGRLPDSLRDGTVHHVDVRRGEAFLRAQRLSRPVAFMKIDVEGHEEAVIEGMIRWISEQMPVIAFEANSNERSERVRKRLEQVGYTNFLGLDFYPRVPWLIPRVLVLTVFGVRHALKSIESLQGRNYSLVFAMTDHQKYQFDNGL